MLSEGQKWFFDGDESTAKSCLIIRKIELNKQDVEVIHVSVKDVNIGGELWDIAHLPVERSVLTKSLKSQAHINFDQDNLQEFEEAYSVWKKDDGGVWNIDLKDIIKTTLTNAGLPQK